MSCPRCKGRLYPDEDERIACFTCGGTFAYVEQGALVPFPIPIDRLEQPRPERPPAPRAPRPAGIPHGTFSGYDYHRCRCDACRRANCEHKRQYRRRSAGLSAVFQHGTTNGYNYHGCRCEPCKKARSSRKRPSRAKAG